MNSWEKIYVDPDWVELRRFDNSLKKVLKRYPDGAPDRLIAQALGITEQEVQEQYDQIVEKLRRAVGEDV